MRAGATVTLLAVALLAAGCGDDDAGRDPAADRATTTAPTTTTPSTSTTVAVAAGRPYTPIHVSRTVRWTPDDGAERVLETEVWAPDRGGPFPLVAFAHGMDGNPAKFTQLFAALAAAGYVVAAPRFPNSSDVAHAPLSVAVADVDHQALDLVQVVEAVRTESASATTGGELAGRVDPTKLALAGLSLGGGTTIVATYGGCCAELRPAVAVAYSPVPFGTAIPAGAPPLVVIHGTDDRTLPYRGSRDLVDRAANRRWFVTLDQGSHSAPYEDNVSPFDQFVPAFTVDVLDQFLLGDDAGMARATALTEARTDAHIEALG